MDLLAENLQMAYLGGEGLGRHTMIFGPDIFFWFSSWLFFLTFQTFLCAFGIQTSASFINFCYQLHPFPIPLFLITILSLFITYGDLWHFLYFFYLANFTSNQLPNLTNFPYFLFPLPSLTWIQALLISCLEHYTASWLIFLPSERSLLVYILHPLSG